jgi:DNA-binding transcriptional ArsR family regulator
MKDEPLLLDLNNPATSALGSELANETGRKILMLLAKGPQSAGMLADQLEIPVNTVLFHIKRLERAGIIKIEEITAGKRGRKKLYSLVSTSIILTTGSKEKTIKSLRNWLETTSKTLWLAARPIAPIILIAVCLAWGWTYFVPFMAPEVRGLGEKGAFQAPSLPAVSEAENISAAPEVGGMPIFSWALTLSLLSAISAFVITLILLRRKSK